MQVNNFEQGDDQGQVEKQASSSPDAALNPPPTAKKAGRTRLICPGCKVSLKANEALSQRLVRVNSHIFHKRCAKPDTPAHPLNRHEKMLVVLKSKLLRCKRCRTTIDVEFKNMHFLKCAKNMWDMERERKEADPSEHSQ